MRIRSLLDFPLFFPYTGINDRGTFLQPGALTHELPFARFSHPLLQRDLRRGHIEVLLTDQERLSIGPADNKMNERNVTLDQGKVIEDEPKQGTENESTEDSTSSGAVEDEKPVSVEAPASDAPVEDPSSDSTETSSEASDPVIPPSTASAARLMAEEGIDPTKVHGTGKNGKITKNDVTTYIEAMKDVEVEIPEMKTHTGLFGSALSDGPSASTPHPLAAAQAEDLGTPTSSSISLRDLQNQNQKNK